MIIKFLVEPQTPLVFSMPQSISLGGYARTRYPLPLPSTISGMIRTAIFEYILNSKNLSEKDLKEKWEEYEYLLGDKESYTGMNWTLIGPYIAVEDADITVYYPVPIDLFLISEHKGLYFENEKLFVFKVNWDALSGFRKMLIDCGDDTYFTISPAVLGEDIRVDYSKGESKKLLSRFIHIQGMRNYLEGKIDNEDYEEVTHDFGYFAKKTEVVGVFLDPEKKTVKFEASSSGVLKGLYYTVEKIWYRKSTYIVFGIRTEDDDTARVIETALDNRILRLGGEGGLVFVRKEDNIKLLEEENKYIEDSGKIKLILTSPAVMRGGYVYPKMKGLVGYAVSDEMYSGWRLIDNKSRPTIICAGSGSVFYFEDTPINVFERGYVRSEYSKIFGSALISRW